MAGHVSADGVVGADLEVGRLLGDKVLPAGGCHRQSACVTDSLCLSQIVCVCHRGSLPVSLCLYQTLFLIILGVGFTYLYVIFINICL